MGTLYDAAGNPVGSTPGPSVQITMWGGQQIISDFQEAMLQSQTTRPPTTPSGIVTVSTGAKPEPTTPISEPPTFTRTTPEVKPAPITEVLPPTSPAEQKERISAVFQATGELSVAVQRAYAPTEKQLRDMKKKLGDRYVMFRGKRMKISEVQKIIRIEKHEAISKGISGIETSLIGAIKERRAEPPKEIKKPKEVPEDKIVFGLPTPKKEIPLRERMGQNIAAGIEKIFGKPPTRAMEETRAKRVVHGATFGLLAPQMPKPATAEEAVLEFTASIPALEASAFLIGKTIEKGVALTRRPPVTVAKEIKFTEVAAEIGAEGKFVTTTKGRVKGVTVVEDILGAKEIKFRTDTFIKGTGETFEITTGAMPFEKGVAGVVKVGREVRLTYPELKAPRTIRFIKSTTEPFAFKTIPEAIGPAVELPGIKIAAEPFYSALGPARASGIRTTFAIAPEGALTLERTIGKVVDTGVTWFKTDEAIISMPKTKLLTKPQFLETGIEIAPDIIIKPLVTKEREISRVISAVGKREYVYPGVAKIIKPTMQIPELKTITKGITQTSLGVISKDVGVATTKLIKSERAILAKGVSKIIPVTTAVVKTAPAKMRKVKEKIKTLQLTKKISSLALGLKFDIKQLKKVRLIGKTKQISITKQAQKLDLARVQMPKLKTVAVSKAVSKKVTTAPTVFAPRMGRIPRGILTPGFSIPKTKKGRKPRRKKPKKKRPILKSKYKADIGAAVTGFRATKIPKFARIGPAPRPLIRVKTKKKRRKK